jgi:2-oxoglutarate dehydrogenase E2 component (dihydrolipoamide succinyltransferase)
MPISIVVPQLGESVAEGTVSKWLKAVGDKVRKEEPLVEIQTDKINVEIPSPADGVLQSIVVPEGTTVLVGTEIGVLGGADEKVANPQEASAGKPEAIAAAAASGARALAGAAAGATPPTAPAQAAGQGARASAAPPAQSAPAPGARDSSGSGNGGGGANGAEDEASRNLSPSVRKIMREENVSVRELGSIQGSGIAGRVTRDDLLEYLRSRAAHPAAPEPARAAASAAPVAREAGPPPGFLTGATTAAAAGPREEVVPFSKVRKLIAENMVRAKQTAAHTHCFDEADMGAIVALRKEWAPRLEAQGVKLTYMPFFIKASVLALREFPWVNGSVRGDAMVVKHYYNIGMAVGREEKGLIEHQGLRPQEPGAARGRSERSRPAGPDRQAQARRHPGRHVQHHERRRLRCDQLLARDQRARGGDPGRPQDPGPRGGP